jgi:hypothetical protein
MEPLRAALLGGDPWLLGCLGQTGPSQDATVTTVLEQVATALSGKKYKGARDKPKVGYVNCKDKLPSGKSLKARFKLRFSKNIPTFFFVGNGRDPKQLKVEEFTTKDKKDKTKLMLAPKVLARYASKASAPKVYAIDSDAAFKRQVLQRKEGSVLLLLGENGGRKGTKLTKAQQRVVTTIMRDHRALRFFSVDLGKWEVRLPATVRHRVLSAASLETAAGGVEAKPPQVLFVDYGPNQTKGANNDVERDSASGNGTEGGTPEPVMGMYRHLNERSKRWEAKQNSSPVSMSMCRHLLHDQMSRKEARRVFQKHKVELAQVASGKRPEALFSHAHALYRINGRYYTWDTAAPFLATAALFDGTLSTDQLTRLDARALHDENKAAAKKAKKEEAAAKTAAKKKGNNFVHRVSSPLGGGRGGGGGGSGGKFSLPAMREAVKKLLAKGGRTVSGGSRRRDGGRRRGGTDGARVSKGKDDDDNDDEEEGEEEEEGDEDDGKLVFHPLAKGKRPKLVKFVSPEERKQKAKKNAAKAKKRQEEAKKKKMKAARKKRKEEKEKKMKAEESKKDRVKRERKRRMQMDDMAKKHFVQSAEDDVDEDDVDEKEEEEEEEEGEVVDDEDDEDEDDNETMFDEEQEDEDVIDLDEDSGDDDEEEVIDLDEDEDEDEDEDDEDDESEVVDLDEL